MSRGGGGGRGGGRGGRGGKRGGGPGLPWENEETDTRPSELFPPFSVPAARSLTSQEQSSVDSFLLIRHQIHDGPLYTARKLAPTSLSASSSNQKHYGQAQLNAKYASSSGTKTRAKQDPFTSVPLYSQRFTRQERTLPDFGSRPYCAEFIPKELHRTFEGDDGPGGPRKNKKRKRITLSKIDRLRTAEEVFGMNGEGFENEWDEEIGEEGEEEDGEQESIRKKRTLEALERLGAEEEAEGGDEGDMEELEEGEEEEQDEEYDDEDAGDYDAEQFFDNGDEMGDDEGDDDGGYGEM